MLALFGSWGGARLRSRRAVKSPALARGRPEATAARAPVRESGKPLRGCPGGGIILKN